MLGVVAEQFPKGGAVTLNAIAGIGMLSVGIIGGPLIGRMQEGSAETALTNSMPGTYEEIASENEYFLGDYTAVDAKKVQALPPQQAEQVQQTVKAAKQDALAKITLFPAIMLACFLGLIVYFKSIGGYRAVSI
jgi:hypothetical protein